MARISFRPSRSLLRAAIATLAMLLVAVVLAGSARAATLTVTNTDDAGEGSLRQQIADAAPGDTINFSVTGTITLTSGQLAINKNLSIAGPGAKDLTVSGNNQSRVFNVASEATVEISGLTIIGGRVVGSTGSSGLNGSMGANGQAGGNGGDAGGGGVLNDGTLTLRGVAVSGNTATGGAGGTGGRGGDGRNNTCGSDADIGGNGGNGGNGGSARGGGVLNEGTLTLQSTTMSSNTAQGGQGGVGGQGGRGGDDGIFCIGGDGGRGGAGGTGGAGRGGAVFNSGTLTATNNTLDGDTARGGQGGSGGRGGDGGEGGVGRGDGGNGGNGGNGGAGEGGATHYTGGYAALTNATVSANQALLGSGGFGGAGGTGGAVGAGGTNGSAGTGRGGGVFSGGATALGNTIVAPNSASTSGPNIFGTFASQGHNLVGDPSGASGFLTSDLQNGDPKLDPLQDNGGQTRTRALQPGSPAIDKGNSFGDTTDQRGSPRPVDLPNVSNAFGGDGSDIGAVEVAAPDTTITSGPSGFVKSTSASLSFISTEVDSTFQCSIDGASFSACSSPKSYSSLSQGKHTFRVRAIDAAGNVDPTPASRSWMVDTVAPKGTVTINGGAAYTRSPSVKLSLSATDPSPASGVASMRLKNDGGSWSGWMTYATKKSWTLKKANGTRAVYVQYRDRAGNLSTAAMDKIKLDMTKPTISGMSPKAGSITKDTTPTIKATVKDNMTNLKKANIKLYVNGKLISASKYSYSAATDKLLYNSPKLTKGKKTVKIVATDAAKNVGIKSWSFTIK